MPSITEICEQAATPEFTLAGRAALVTGASRGIGRAIAIGLARWGARVVLHYHQDETAAESVAETIQANGGFSVLAQADLTKRDAGAHLAETALATGPIDILVLNAAIQERRVLGDIDRALFERHVFANLWSAVELLQAILPPMTERGWGRVLGIGSVQQVRPNPNLLIYAGLKSALSTLLRSLAKAHAAHGVTINVLAPGLIDTDRTTDLKRDPDLYQSILDRIPAGRAGDPQDCVGPALLLCSDAGRYITGTDLLVDGGMHLP
jgi:NAD(P)-dependent dehydrogenase (short-subunit alcohol dehydrogenase family)